MIARHDTAHALGEQHPLEPARPAPPVVRLSPHRARRIDAEPIELLPPASRRPSRPFPWRVFPVAAVVGVGLHYSLQIHALLFIAMVCIAILGLTWWLLRWIDEDGEPTKEENGW